MAQQMPSLGICPGADFFARWIWVRRARAGRTGVSPTALVAPVLSPGGPRVSHEDGFVALQENKHWQLPSLA